MLMLCYRLVAISPNWSNNQSVQIYTMKAVKYQFSLSGVALIKSHAQVKK